VSTLDQNPERQLEQVQVDRLFTDKLSGKDIKRPQLESLLSFVREGDTVVVHSMDRLARNLEDLRRLVRNMTKRGVRIEFLKENLTFMGEGSPSVWVRNASSRVTRSSTSATIAVTAGEFTRRKGLSAILPTVKSAWWSACGRPRT